MAAVANHNPRQRVFSGTIKGIRQHLCQLLIALSYPDLDELCNAEFLSVFPEGEFAELPQLGIHFQCQLIQTNVSKNTTICSLSTNIKIILPYFLAIHDATLKGDPGCR